MTFFARTTGRTADDDDDDDDDDSEENNVSGDEDGSDDDDTLTVPRKLSGFCRPGQLSPRLSEFMSCGIMPRTEVVKKIWVYIKENGLQNPEDKREILCDEKLESLFDCKRLSMFSLNKLLAPMITPIPDLPEDQTTTMVKKSKKKPVKSASSKAKKAQEEKLKGKKKRKSKKDRPPRVLLEHNLNPFGGAVLLSRELSELLGERELPRTEVTRLMWRYIKEHGLQNAEDGREIFCDAKLRKVFKVSSFTMFQMASLLKPMLIKIG